jgi:hypothetical protein
MILSCALDAGSLETVEEVYAISFKVIQGYYVDSYCVSSWFQKRIVFILERIIIVAGRI